MPIITLTEAEKRARDAAEMLVTGLRQANEQFVLNNPQDGVTEPLQPLDEQAVRAFEAAMFSAVATRYVIVPDPT